MGSTTTIKNESEAHCKPKKETIEFLLNYSRSIEVQKSSSGKEYVFMRN